MRRRLRWWALLSVLLLLGSGLPPTAAAQTEGAWATYRFESALKRTAPVVYKEVGPGGEVTWRVAEETVSPAPLYVTYAVVKASATEYTLQVATSLEADGPPLSVTQIVVDRKTGKAKQSVIRRPKGLIGTVENELRPFREAGLPGGIREEVQVAAGRFTALRAPYKDGTVWVSDQVPAIGLVKAVFPHGTLELVRSAASGAKDLLRS